MSGTGAIEGDGNPKMPLPWVTSSAGKGRAVALMSCKMCRQRKVSEISAVLRIDSILTVRYLNR
jgi:hypothetical protein